MIELPLLLGAAFFAGLVDAVVGGGGLVQVPALFATFPAALPATVFGTNKLASVFGTSAAAWRYARRIELPLAIALPAALAAFAASYGGALVVALLPKEWLRPLVLVLLVLVAFYTMMHKDFGTADGGRIYRGRDRLLAALLGALIGFYDGFFGPGAGSFLIFMFVRVFALDFLRASASSKVVNAGTNLAALLYFVPSGNVLVAIGLGMAAFNIAGSFVGSHLALTRGALFVRKIFLLAVGLLIIKFAYDTFQ
jgi:hypothetical protein